MRSCRLLLELESAGPWLGGKVLERRCGLGGGGAFAKAFGCL